MNILLYLSTDITPLFYPQYPHKHDKAEVELIDTMYETEVKEIDGSLGERPFFSTYSDFLNHNVEVSQERMQRAEKLTAEEFERLKKRLAENCPNKEICYGCSIGEGDCRLLHGWKRDGDDFWHSYSLLGEYLPNLKKVVLYVNNIDDACGKPTCLGVLPTYIHELFHAFFHYVTEQKHAGYNYVREIEEAMAEFSTLVFLRQLKMKDDENGREWEEIFDWAYNEIGKKQKAVGDLPAYGFGRYLYDSIPDAFGWINKYAERLGYIDEEDELVKQYKQMVYPSYPTEPQKCLELLEKILFETGNQPMQPREIEKSDDGVDNVVIVDYTPPYDSFFWKGLLHIEYDLSTDDFNYCNGPMGRWDLSVEDIARIKAFLKDENNLLDFFDDRKAYSVGQAIITEHYRAYELHINWKGRDKTISVGIGSSIPFKHPFYSY